MTDKKLIAGNWKMNGSIEDAKSLIADIANGLHREPELLDKADFLVCPPFVHINIIRHALFTLDTVDFGAQDCSAHENGAYTGDISAAMLADAQCSYVILGHSERRHGLGETNQMIADKAACAHENNLTTIICVGETEAERDAGKEIDVVLEQLEGSIPSGVDAKNLVIAYEPVWAIGTGKTAMSKDVDVMHRFIRECLQNNIHNGLEDFENIRILYGGSVKPDNANVLLNIPNVDGALIGGASLKAQDFLGIARAV